MAQTYLLFDFGSDEEKAQQARHKLEGWKQAFRLDKKLLYKLDRESFAAGAESDAEAPEESAKPSKSGGKSGKSAKSVAKGKSKSKRKSDGDSADTPAAAANGKVSLLVRLYFSGHEKLTEQRWIERIPAEEPFKDASPRVIRQGTPEFDELVQQFEALE